MVLKQPLKFSQKWTQEAIREKMQDLNETALPTPDLVWPIFGGNLDYFRYFTTQCALFRTKKILAI